MKGNPDKKYKIKSNNMKGNPGQVQISVPQPAGSAEEDAHPAADSLRCQGATFLLFNVFC